MTFTKIATLSITVAAALCLASCKDYVGKETTHPFYQQAETAKINRDYTGAAAAYKNFMKVCPESAKVHQDLAMLYSDYLQDYENAVAHYQTYLEMAGATMTAEEKAAVARQIQTCKTKAFLAYREKNNIMLASDMKQKHTDDDYDSLKNYNDAYVKALKDFDEKNKQLVVENKELREKLEQANATIRSSAQQKTASSTKSSDSGKTAEGSTAVADKNASGQKVYTVVKGDGLQAISKKVYGTARYATLIEKANKDVLGDRGILKIGQKLVIPAIPE